MIAEKDVAKDNCLFYPIIETQNYEFNKNKIINEFKTI